MSLPFTDGAGSFPTHQDTGAAFPRGGRFLLLHLPEEKRGECVSIAQVTWRMSTLRWCVRKNSESTDAETDREN